jgi:hypothetical protein
MEDDDRMFRTSLGLQQPLYDAIEVYQHANMIKSTSEAMRRLLVERLQQLGFLTSKTEP